MTGNRELNPSEETPTLLFLCFYSTKPTPSEAKGKERGLSAPNLAVAKWEREDEEEEEGRDIDSS